MVPSTVSQRKTITYSLATVVFFQCLMSMPGACPSCYAARTWNAASASATFGADEEMVAPNRLAGLEMAGGPSGNRSCTCFWRALRVPYGPLRLHEDVTATRVTGNQSFLPLPAAPEDRLERLTGYASSETGLLSATQRCARSCRFLL
jgi:hypothetical protein